MRFKISHISPTVELVFENNEKLINVYPAYHQKGGLVYQNVDRDAWTVVGTEYRWFASAFDITNDTIPVIQLVYSMNATAAEKQQQYLAFRSITVVETVPGKLCFYAPTRPSANFRIRYRILNKMDLAIPLNRYFGIGLGYGSDYEQLYSYLTALNPVTGATTCLASSMPVATYNKAGVMSAGVYSRLVKLEGLYDNTLEKPYRIDGYASQDSTNPITTYYQTIDEVKAVSANTWYGDCELRTRTNISDFTSADYLFYQQQATSLNLTHVYTGNVTTFRYALAANRKLTDITGLQLLDTHRATDISYMFAHNSALKRLDLSSLCLANVDNIEGLFYGCTGLEYLDVRGINFRQNSTREPSLISQPNIFDGVPDDCIIWVSGSDQREAILARYPNLTGITYN